MAANPCTWLYKSKFSLPLSLPLTAFIAWYSILHANPQSTENTRFLRCADTAFYTLLKIQIPPSAPTTQSLWLRGFLYISTFSAVLGGKNIFHYDNKKLKKDILSSILRTEPPRCKSEGVSFALFNSRDCLHPLQIFLDPSLFRHDNLFPNLLRIGPLQPCPGTLTPAHQKNIRQQLHLLLTFACGLIE